MRVKLIDLYKLKISNSMYYITKIIYFITIFIITKFVNDEEFLLIYKLIFFIYLLLIIINLVSIKLRQFDIFFISNRNKVFVTYLKLIFRELGYLFIMITPVLYKFDLNSLLTLYLYNVFYFLLISFIYIAQAKVGGLYSILIIMGLLTNTILNYEQTNIILLNITQLENIYLISDIYYNFLFLTLTILLSYFSYKNSSFRNIF